MRDLPRDWSEIGGVVRQFEVEVRNVDMRLVPVDQRDPLGRHKNIAWIGITMDNTGLSTGKPCPSGSAPRDTLGRHPREVDASAPVRVQQVNG